MNYEQTASSSHIKEAVIKFHTLNDDLHATHGVVRKVFFEFLRTQPTLTSEEVEQLHSVADLLAAVCRQ